MNNIPSRLVIIAGTYDGVLAGWDTVEHTREADANDIELKLLRRNDGRHLKLSFAMSAHEGSVRCIDVAGGGGIAALSNMKAEGGGKTKNKKKRQRSDSVDSNTSSQEQPPPVPEPGMLLSGGYDETINVFNLQKHAQAGELKTPGDLGSPLCCSFAPPSNKAIIMDNGTNTTTTATTTTTPTHALVGLTSGKVLLYKKKDWSVQHVLSGHDEGGVQCLAVHPTGRMALTGGRDGKIILWDLMKGRLAFVHKLPNTNKSKGSKRKETVNHIVWSDDGSRYAYCYGTKITARDVAATGSSSSGGGDLLDVDMMSRVNQLAFIGGPEGMFVAAACDDGGLPVLEVGRLEEETEDGDGDAGNERRAIMAIEPVDRIVAGDDRLKCIKSVEGGSGFLVVTANSGGVVSLMDLEGAARMMLTSNSGGGSDEDEDDEKGSDEEDDSENEDDDEVEAAVEIIDSVRIGSGARITDLAVWSYGSEPDLDDIEEDEPSIDGEEDDVEDEAAAVEDDEEAEEVEEPPSKKTRKGAKENKGAFSNRNEIELDEAAVEKARKLVGQAKKRDKKKKKKKQKQENA